MDSTSHYGLVGQGLVLQSVSRSFHCLPVLLTRRRLHDPFALVPLLVSDCLVLDRTYLTPAYQAPNAIPRPRCFFMQTAYCLQLCLLAVLLISQYLGNKLLETALHSGRAFESNCGTTVSVSSAYFEQPTHACRWKIRPGLCISSIDGQKSGPLVKIGSCGKSRAPGHELVSVRLPHSNSILYTHLRKKRGEEGMTTLGRSQCVKFAVKDRCIG
jgi:hypothetical protein